MTPIGSIQFALPLATEDPEIPPPDYGPIMPEPILEGDHFPQPAKLVGDESTKTSTSEVCQEPDSRHRNDAVRIEEARPGDEALILSRGANRLLTLIRKFIGKYGNFYASQCWIGDHLARCARTVYRWTQELIRCGFISLRRRSQNTLVYTLLNRKMSDQMSGHLSDQMSGRIKEELNKPYIPTTAASPPQAATTALRSEETSEQNRKPPRQVSAAVTQLFKDLWQNHPEPDRGSMTFALSQLEACLANETDAATIRTRHAEYCRWWAIERSSNPGSYIPWLGRFFRDGDWRIAPHDRARPELKQSKGDLMFARWLERQRAKGAAA